MIVRIAVMAAAIAAAALGAVAETARPYAGMQTRPIKALSEQQIADLMSGRGMGLALAAELNGYPGPMHVLELADQLALSAEQRSRIEQLFAAMKDEAIPLGRELLEKESDLDRQFATRAVTAASLHEATAKIGPLQARLREAHLKYHLATAALLNAEQMHRYAELRGYAKSSNHHTPQH